MGLFDGIEEAEIFERGRFLPPGFVGVLEVKRTLAKDSIKSGVGFIVEFKVIESNLETVSVDSKATWWQGMKDRTVAFPSIKEFIAVLSGFERHQKKEIEAEVSPSIRSVLDHATKHPDDNDLIGCRICVETANKRTKNDRDFTMHLWSPYRPAATEAAAGQ